MALLRKSFRITRVVIKNANSLSSPRKFEFSLSGALVPAGAPSSLGTLTQVVHKAHPSSKRCSGETGERRLQTGHFASAEYQGSLTGLPRDWVLAMLQAWQRNAFADVPGP